MTSDLQAGFGITAYREDGSCVKLAQRKDPPCGKKKAIEAKNRLQTDTTERLHRLAGRARANALFVA